MLSFCEVEVVFTDEDNKMLCVIAKKEDVKEVLWNSNQHAAPGTDGLTAFLYQLCWDLLGDSLTEASKEVFKGEKTTSSQ